MALVRRESQAIMGRRPLAVSQVQSRLTVYTPST